MSRLRRERPDVDAGELAGVLDELPDLVAVTLLGPLCERYGWPRAAATLDHLVPSASPGGPGANERVTRCHLASGGLATGVIDFN